jgi:predicted DNA-binding protein YlxM (UPF0122 family)
MATVESVVVTEEDIKNILHYYFGTDVSAQTIAEKYKISVSVLKQLVKANAYRYRYN